MSEDDASGPRQTPAVAAMPTADAVVPWIRTLALLAGVLTLLTTLLTLELLVRI